MSLEDDDNLNPLSQSSELESPTLTSSVDPRFNIKTPEIEDDRSLLGEARRESWVLGTTRDVERLFESHEDTDYEMGDEEFAALSDKYDKEQLKAFLYASSEEERDALYEEFDEANERRSFLKEHGWKGTAAEMGMMLTDPVLWAATIGAEFGGAAIVGVRAARMARLVRTLGSAGVSEAALVSLRNQVENDYSDRDMAYDFLAALTVAGGVELAFGKSTAALVKEHEKTVTDKLLEEQGLKDAGAAERRADVEDWRYDDYARRMKSGNQEVMSFAETHLQDPVRGGSDSTAVKAERMRSHYLGRANKAFEELWDTVKQKDGAGSSWNAVENARQRYALSEKIWEARGMSVDHGPEIQKVADEFGKQYDEMLAQAEDAGLAGFSREMSNPLYMKQEWDSRQFLKLRDELGEDDLVELINRGLYGFDEEDLLEAIALKKAEIKEFTDSNPKLREGADDTNVNAATKELSELEAIRDARSKLALGFTNRMLGLADGDQRSLTELLEDEDTLVQWLRDYDEYEGMSEQEVKAFVSKALSTKSKGGNADVVDRAKRRIAIDPTASLLTPSGRNVTVSELMNRDAIGLHQSYVHSMTGHVAFAENGIKKPSDWQDVRKSIARFESKRLADDPNAEAKVNELLEKVEGDKREIYGLPRFDTSTGALPRLTNMMLKYNFMTAMGKAAFSALSEMGRILGENGVRNTLKTLTSLDGLIADSLRTVNKGKHVVSEVNGFNGSIGDEYLVRLFNSFDETGVREGSHTAGLMSKAEIITHRGAQIMSKGSLLAPVDKALRMVSFSSSVNNIYGHLIKGRKSRLALDQMGLSQDDLWNIRKYMRQYTEVSPLGHVTRLGIENWDRAVADKFMNALTTNGARQVQKALAGESAAITQHPVGRVFFQFRKFAIDSYAKHLRADLRDLPNHPVRVMLSTMYASIFAVLGYTGRMHISAAGKDGEEREEFLKERLDQDVVIANAAQYTPNMGVFVTGWNALPGLVDDDFSIPVYRATNLDTDLFANPTFDKINRFKSLFHNVKDAEAENAVDKISPFIPGQNTIPGDLIRNSLDSLAQ